MARILTLGYGPLPFERERKNLALGKRTWQLTKTLLKAGHEVRLLCGRHHHAYFREESLPPIEEASFQGFGYTRVAPEVLLDGSWLQKQHDAFRPDIIVGTTVAPLAAAMKLHTTAPVWADLNGDPLVEAQAQAAVYQNNALLSMTWREVGRVLKCAHSFSAVSQAQAWALVGQLACQGRLTAETLGYEFVSVIPVALDPEGQPSRSGLVDFPELPEGSFVLLWSGGFNTWSDGETLIRALREAVNTCPELHLVITGGSLEGHDELSWHRMMESVEGAGLSQRVHSLGWVDTANLPGIYKRCDAALSTDKRCYEALLGSRNRFLEWFYWGLPVVTSLASELSQAVREREIGYTFTPEDPVELAELLVSLPQRRTALKVRAERAREYVLSECSLEATTRPLVQWVERVMKDGLPPGLRHRVHLEDHGLRKELSHKWANLKAVWEVEGMAGVMRKVGEKIIK